uniref:SUEL-type lectin domain-containing protein n=1 Tax=Anopheles farauti TaxID=69004 RepID=A0A182QIG0_9DIPT
MMIMMTPGDDADDVTYGLLSSTLRAFRTICCDDEMLTLSCPIGTSISVELVQYGAKESNDTLQCAYSELDSPYYVPEPTAVALSTVDFGGAVGAMANATTSVTATPTVLSTNEPTVTNDTLASVERPKDKCTPLYVLQYSILQTVVEACQKKRRCRMQATPKNFATAPCPGIHRMVEVNHKCRPFEFRSLISCEKDIVRLACGQYTRIAIYSATYGRTAYESSHCTQAAASKEQTCLSEHTSHTLTEICQGRRKCTVAVESSTFGNPCPENIRVYLKVIYACVSRNVFRARYITPLEEDELDERPYESNELYDEELTPAPNQIEGSTVGKGAGGNHNKYATGGSGESAVKAENIVTYNKDGVDSSTGGSSDYSSLLDQSHLVVVSVAVLCFSCLCVAFGALLAYRMKLFPASGNRCIKASESTDNSHSTPSTGYRASSDDFDLVECIPEQGTTLVEKPTEQPAPPAQAPQTFVQPVATAATVPISAVPPGTTLLPAFKFAEPRGSLSQISTTMFILPNYLMAGPHPGTLSNRRPKDATPGASDNLTITLTDLGPGTSGRRMESPSPAHYYTQPLPPHHQHQQHQHQQHQVPSFGTGGGSCGQCVALGWQQSAGNAPTPPQPLPPPPPPPTMYGGQLMALEHPVATSKPSHPYHRNQSLKSSTGEPEGRADPGGGVGDEAGGRAERKPVGGTTSLAQSHPFLWLGLKIGLM